MWNAGSLSVTEAKSGPETKRIRGKDERQTVRNRKESQRHRKEREETA